MVRGPIRQTFFCFGLCYIWSQVPDLGTPVCVERVHVSRCPGWVSHPSLDVSDFVESSRRFKKTKNANPSVSFQRYLVLLVIPHRFQATSGNTDLSFLPWIPLSIYIKMRLNASVRMDLAVLAKNKAGWSGSPLMIHLPRKQGFDHRPVEFLTQNK